MLYFRMGSVKAKKLQKEMKLFPYNKKDVIKGEKKTILLSCNF